MYNTSAIIENVLNCDYSYCFDDNIVDYINANAVGFSQIKPIAVVNNDETTILSTGKYITADATINDDLFTHADDKLPEQFVVVADTIMQKLFNENRESLYTTKLVFTNEAFTDIINQYGVEYMVRILQTWICKTKVLLMRKQITRFVADNVDKFLKVDAGAFDSTNRKLRYAVGCTAARSGITLATPENFAVIGTATMLIDTDVSDTIDINNYARLSTLLLNTGDNNYALVCCTKYTKPIIHVARQANLHSVIDHDTNAVYFVLTLSDYNGVNTALLRTGELLLVNL